ncbi:class I SAM-dependent methyltransferase [Paenibacillus senegalensis]|uniref:class I SAM-dependent methyltransferase n=1 Tax=Paenibacillus senegalensis TaxID=1465766 RepID=UPI0011DCEDD3|nr:class I SAM-dependent methyltransferase [Paenibacillus senegalensis]
MASKYIHDHINNHFQLDDKMVLDFGAGTGANCCICKPDYYLGIEPDARRVGLAQRLYPNHRFMIFDEKQIPAPDASIDYIFVIAVLHHLDDSQIKNYLLEFERVLKPGGKIIAIEPCLWDHTPFQNRFMNWYDDGKYIRKEEGYLNFFHEGQYHCQVLKKFTKCFVYNEILFSAQRDDGTYAVPSQI